MPSVKLPSLFRHALAPVALIAVLLAATSLGLVLNHKLAQQLSASSASLSQVDLLAEEITQWEQWLAKQNGQSSFRKLLAGVKKIAVSIGLTDPQLAVHNLNNRRIAVIFTRVPYDALLNWLIASKNKLRFEIVQLKISRHDRQGNVNARLVLSTVK